MLPSRGAAWNWRLLVRIAPRPMPARKDVPEPIDDLEPSRSLDDKNCTPQVTVLTATPALPVPNRENSFVHEKWNEHQDTYEYWWKHFEVFFEDKSKRNRS